MSIIDYSDKSFVVIGANTILWESLAELGGLYNARLKVGTEPTKGWVFSKKKLSNVQMLLNSTTNNSSVSVKKNTGNAGGALATVNANDNTNTNTNTTPVATGGTPNFPIPVNQQRKYISTTLYRDIITEIREVLGKDGETHTTEDVLQTIDRFTTRLMSKAMTLDEWRTQKEEPSLYPKATVATTFAKPVKSVKKQVNKKNTSDTDSDSTDSEDV